MNPESTMPKVLVVEDDAAMRALLTRQLRRKGFDVTEAEDAESVLNQGSGGSGFDLVVTDVHLPGQSGVELARHLRRDDANSRVVFVTGDHDEGLAREALAEGAAGYLLKPFAFFELEALVRAALKPVQALRRRNATSIALVSRREAGQGRNLTRVVDEQRALARFQEAVRRPEKVVIRHGRSASRPSRIGWKAIAAVAASIMLSWLAGAKVFRDASEVVDPALQQAPMTQAATAQPVIIPMVVEQRSYGPPR
jgi:DNA-binding response OmpR family regulator